jgi:SAM-dependent methyltransferase
MDHPTNTTAPVLEHYGTQDLTQRVEQALRRAGLGRERLDWSDLAPLDQFHVRGLGASRELATGLNLTQGARLMDVGCGLGGPARYLAAVFGAQVTGIDLNPSFVEVARMLSERSGLGERARVRQADALDLPFADASFDHAWTQHVAMNIADRTRFYRNIHHILKPGGSLAIYDVVAGDGTPLVFPVPWARRPEDSHLLTAEAMREALRQSGFEEVAWTDQTAAGLAWFGQQRAAPIPAQPPALGLHVVMGPEFKGMMANLGRNLEQGRVGLLQAILRSA